MNSLPPRVLHFVPGFRSGGVESLLLELYRALDRDRLQFDFLVDTKDALPAFAELRGMGARVFQLGRFLDAPWKYHLASKEIFRRHGAEYVALHCHEVLRALPLLMLARTHGIPKRILHQHSSSLAGSRKALVAKAISSVTLPWATDLFACSRSAAEFYFSGCDYRIFPNAIRSDRFRMDVEKRAQVRHELNIPDSAEVLGHTGRFTFLKNHEWLLQVFAAVKRTRPRAHLLLVGDGPLLPEMRVLARRLSIDDCVHFVGETADVAPYLCAMDVFVLPSHSEGFCISLLEAQANGLRCLVSKGVPPDVQLSPMTVRDLEEPVEEWAKSAVSLLAQGREPDVLGCERVCAAGLDVKAVVPRMLEMYGLGNHSAEVRRCVSA